MVVIPECSASSTSCGQIQWMVDDALHSGIHVGLNVRIAGLADGDDTPVPESSVGLDDPPMIHDQGVGDDGVDGAILAADLGLAHAIADHLAAAEFHFLAVMGAVFFDLDKQVRIGKAHTIANSGAEHGGVGAAINGICHGSVLQLSLNFCVKAFDDAIARIRDQRYLACLPGLKTDRRSSRNVEPLAAGRVTVEIQRGVGLKKMIVRADLDRTVAGVGNAHGGRLAAFVENDVSVGDDDFSWDHGFLLNGSGYAR
jgi:hypothetical protein